jgi:hypothetical protein
LAKELDYQGKMMEKKMAQESVTVGHKWENSLIVGQGLVKQWEKSAKESMWERRLAEL